MGGPQYGPQNTIILIMGTPKKVPLILGNYHFSHQPPLPISVVRVNFDGYYKHVVFVPAFCLDLVSPFLVYIVCACVLLRKDVLRAGRKLASITKSRSFTGMAELSPKLGKGCHEWAQRSFPKGRTDLMS